jgi:prepilin-type processing-associated H-X9-DG protein
MTEPTQGKQIRLGRIVFGFVAAICLLMVAKGVFLAALNQAKEHSPRADCLSNLKQLGIAIAMYADLYQGRCPVDSTNPTLVGSMQLLSNVFPLISGKILYCPSDHRPGARAEPDFKKLTTMNISYSYVPNLIWTDATPDAIAALDRIDSTSAGSGWPSDGNHKQAGGNVLFMDGHVQFQTRLPSALKDKNGKEIVLSP